MSANIRCSSSQTVVVPFGERFGRPSGVTVATKPSDCSRTTRCMSTLSSIRGLSRRPGTRAIPGPRLVAQFPAGSGADGDDLEVLARDPQHAGGRGVVLL